MQVHSKYKDQITTQQYTKQTTIADVEVVEGKLFNDDSGNFAEFLRLNEQQEVEGLTRPFIAKQLSMSVMVPGTIKAYHVHNNQDDLWFVSPFDRVLVNLHDLREDSATFDTHMRLVLGSGKNIMLRIPAGVAHGAANIYERPMTLIYATSQQFNSDNPDEHRLPWDIFGSQLWELTKG